MLGNGLCTRPVEHECRMESACETVTEHFWVYTDGLAEFSVQAQRTLVSFPMDPIRPLETLTSSVFRPSSTR